MNDEVISAEEGNAGTNHRPGAPTTAETSVTVSGSNAIHILILCGLTVAILATAAYVYYQSGKINKYAGDINEIEQQTGALNNKLEVLDGAYGETKAAITRIENQQEMLHDSIDSLYKNRKNDNVDWALAEIEHLLIIATQELSLDADVNTALAAMQAADDRLKDMSDPSVLPVRS